MGMNVQAPFEMGLRILKSLIDDALVLDEGTPEGILGESRLGPTGGLPKLLGRPSLGERLGDAMPKRCELCRRRPCVGRGRSRPSSKRGDESSVGSGCSAGESKGADEWSQGGCDCSRLRAIASLALCSHSCLTFSAYRMVLRSRLTELSLKRICSSVSAMRRTRAGSSAVGRCQPMTMASEFSD